MFRVGQKVVCVDDSGDRYGRFEDLPVKDEVYTIRKSFGRAVLLEEIVNPPHHYAEAYDELRFKAWRFRPLTDTKSEVSFTIGADPESERWDNRKPVPVRKRERV